jgi:predicted TIM-barrel enzyme
VPAINEDMMKKEQTPVMQGLENKDIFILRGSVLRELSKESFDFSLIGLINNYTTLPLN